MRKDKIVDEIDALIIAYKKCDDEKKKKIIHIRAVENTIPLVKKIAAGVSAQSNASCEDLLQVGSIGLIKAIEFFDPEKNVKFKTYASYFIRGEIKHYLRDKVSIIKAPREMQELMYKITNTIKTLKAKGYDSPTEMQIAEIIGTDAKKIHDVLEIETFKTTLSLDQTVSSVDEEELSLIDRIPAGDYQEFINSCENKIMIAQSIEKLPADLKEIIELSYYHDLNQREISEKIHISQMQVSRRLKKALSKLYEIIKRDGEI